MAAIVLWFLWLRKGRIGALGSSSRAFDKSNKPARRVSWLHIFAGSIGFALWIAFWHFPRFIFARVQDAKAARVRNRPDRIGMNLPKEDVATDEEPQEETPANQPAARDCDEPPGNDND